MKVGLVLEGGSMRGMFTAGVLDVMMENNINVDGIMGVSAGALFGPNYYSGQKGRVIRYNKKYIGNKKYISKRNLFLTGNAVNKNFAFYKLQRKLDPFDNERFLETAKPFWAVATNIKTGAPEYFEITNPFDDMEKLRASAAVPLASRPVKINNNKYLDGGVSDGIPFMALKEKGFDKIIIILTQPLKYRRKPVKPQKMKMIRFLYHRYPNFIKTIENWYLHYNETVEKIIDMENKKKIFVIRPPKSIWAGLDEQSPDRLQEIYDIGKNEAIKKIDELKNYLNS